ncbi:MFS transporter [Nocardioides sp. 1609]|uniref:MFS transporter n=1 Tax=Nocardioides sp. 1609 TaxID=2508327 RepID=UPI001ADBACD8|nr:MFS transporter [Nocardioides sp. 1609]
MLDGTPSPRRWWLLAALALSQLMIALDTTIVTIALPSAQADLGFGNDSRQWVVTGYALAFGSLLLLSGRLADRLGRKQTLITGLAGFAVASAIGGAAPSLEFLVGARIGQGVFAALLAPAALAIVSTTFSNPSERAKAFGLFGSVSMVGTTVGLLLGGFLTETLSWRWTMYINVLIAAPAVVGAVLLAPSSRRLATQLDLRGATAVTSGLFALVLGTSNAETKGWTSAVTIVTLVAAVVLLALFVFLQARVPVPLLPLHVILDRSRGGALIALLLSSAGLFATFLFLPYYLQSTLQFSQIRTGVAFLPVPVVLVLAAAILGPALSRALGVRVVIPLGLAIAGMGPLLLTRLEVDSSYLTHLLPSLVLIGAGIGLVVATATGTATARVHDDDAGAAAASVNAAQQIGGSIGIAVLSTVAAAATASYTANHTGSNLEALATVASYTTAFGWTAALFYAGAVLTALVLPKARTGRN